ncbi:alpha-glucosidase [Mesoterricola silvestris]|uniref:Alpha-glucosidase n=1 Tax=Mesoterricola silvestris TaxID=2927979 RepID=A0AA48GM27_9BACT|nr:alpha-glucosidase [Mesoterricola silvestris]BDU71980.1 alpha-glucosidase [Mesoterricola silvestris]
MTSQFKEDQGTRRAEWWRGASIYQIYPRSFQDTNGDGVGDLPGITAHLPYIADLGIEAIWISPFFTSPMRDFGYDVSDYRNVDPIFGSLADFDELVEKAHKLGLKVLIDQVLSHSSDQHPWFKESRSNRTNARSDWYVWADPRPDGTPPSNWQSVFGGAAWAWEPRRRQYYLHNFLESQPDLNFHCQAVQDQMLEECRFWLERGVDGFRFDACNFHFHDPALRNNPPARGKALEVSSVRPGNPYGMQVHRFDKTRPENLPFLRRVRALLDAYGAVSVGEVGDEDSLATMAEYTGGGDKLHMAYGMHLLTDEFSVARIRGAVEAFEKRVKAGSGWACWSLSNHDCARVVSRWGNGTQDPAFPKVLLAMLGSLRGTFCVYQGEELGLTEAVVPKNRLTDPYGIAFWPDFKGRDGCRTPIPWTPEAPFGGFSGVDSWLPMPAEHLARAVSVQAGTPGSVLDFYRTFLAWRRLQPALRKGSITFLRAADPLLVLRRESPEQSILAVFNLGPLPAEYTLPPHIDPLLGHGLEPAPLKGRRLSLAPWGGFFGQSRPSTQQ